MAASGEFFQYSVLTWPVLALALNKTLGCYQQTIVRGSDFILKRLLAHACIHTYVHT